MDGNLKMLIVCGHGGHGCAKTLAVFSDYIPIYTHSCVEIYGVEKTTLGWDVLTSAGDWTVDILIMHYIHESGKEHFLEVQQETSAMDIIESYKLRQSEAEGEE